MKFCPTTFLTVVIAMTGVLTPFSAVSAQVSEDQFQDITTDVPQSVSEIYLPPNCPSSGHHPRTMFTILPTESAQNGVSIQTYPKDLVTARGAGKTLQLEWNVDSASTANEGGVKIYMPADQLESVTTAADSKAQILDGFTSIERLRVSSDSKLTAVMTQNLNTNLASLLTVTVNSDGEAKVITTGPCNRIEVSSDAKLSIAAMSANEFRVSSDGNAEFKGNSVGYADISSDGRLTLDGNLTDGGSISSDGELTVYGQANGRIRVSSDGKLYVRDELLGDVDASSDAKVYAPSCDTVSTNSDAKCHVKDNISGEVAVEIGMLPFTLTGTEKCWFSTWSSLSGGYIALIVFAVLACVGFCIWRCHARRKCRNSQRATASDFDVVYPAGTGGISSPCNDDEKKAPQAEEDPSAVAYPVDHDPEKQHEYQNQDPNEQAPIKAEAISVEPMEQPPASSSYDPKNDPAYKV